MKHKKVPLVVNSLEDIMLFSRNLNENIKYLCELEDKGVRNSNAAAISGAAMTMKNIGLYLPSLLQFYQK